MSSRVSELSSAAHSLVAPAAHSLHEAEDEQEFCARFKAATGSFVEQVADGLIEQSVPRAVFLVGSLPLGMATSGSDIDFIVLVDDNSAMLSRERAAMANTAQRLAFSNDSNPLVSGSFVTLINGIAVEVQVAIAPTISHIQRRLRTRGPELSDSEIMTLSRLSTGWMLWQSVGYLERSGLSIKDPALDIYCSTRNFVDALILRRKAMKARDLADMLLAFHLGRLSVEKAYLAYFASEGYSYLGPKWMAQISQARGAKARLARHPLLKESVHLLFPELSSTEDDATQYMLDVSCFLTAMRQLVEQKVLFRIAYSACPQIFHIT